MSNLKTQFGKSKTASISLNTWKFVMPDDFKCTAGEFAILPSQKYHNLIKAMKSIMLSMSAHPDYEPDSEFMDMVEKCEDALNEVQ